MERVAGVYVGCAIRGWFAGAAVPARDSDARADRVAAAAGLAAVAGWPDALVFGARVIARPAGGAELPVTGRGIARGRGTAIPAACGGLLCTMNGVFAGIAPGPSACRRTANRLPKYGLETTTQPAHGLPPAYVNANTGRPSNPSGHQPT
jgi:hypothetical protein